MKYSHSLIILLYFWLHTQNQITSGDWKHSKIISFSNSLIFSFRCLVKFCQFKKKKAAQKPMPNTACFLLNVVFLNFNHVNIKKKNSQILCSSGDYMMVT
jgi:lipid-A-disaccharide synthase-like uncharacterized protein